MSLNSEERRIRHNELNAAWRAKNPTYFSDYAAKHADELREYYKGYYKESVSKDPEKFILRSRESRQKVKLQVVKILGGKCVSPECRWVNEDMTLGCTDPRILDVDHINGGGRKEVEELGYHAIMRSIVEYGNQGKYQLLCRCCNHLKRIRNGEHGKGKPNGAHSS